jgi:hypothetical protein
LSAECRRRGLRTIVDVSDPDRLAGQAQYDALRQIIQTECDDFILYMTRNISESACVWKVEVPAALTAFDGRNYGLLPVFRDVSPSEVRCFEPHGRRISTLAGVVVGDGCHDTAVAAAHVEVANLTLATRLRRDASVFAQRPLVLGIRTRETGVQPVEADLLLDWGEDYARSVRDLDSRSAVLSASLRDVARAIAAARVRALRITGPAHLSAGLAVGLAFHRATGCQVEVAHKESWWAASGDKAPAGVRVAAHQLDAAAADVVVVLAVSRPEIGGDVEASIGDLGSRVGGRLVIQPAGGAGRETVLSGSHARGIIAATTEVLIRCKTDWGTRGVTHVFLATPFALAALLGHALNGFGPLALYEPAAGGRYVRVLTLD